MIKIPLKSGGGNSKNLFINGDFLINTRKITTTYTSGKVSDCWFFQTSLSEQYTIEESGGIMLWGQHASIVVQYIEDLNNTVEYTLSFKLKNDETIYSCSFTPVGALQQEIKTGIKLYQPDDYHWVGLMFNFGDDSNQKYLQWMHLNEGSSAETHIAEDKGEAKQRCLPYCQRIEGRLSSPYYRMSQSASWPACIPVYMKSPPTLTRYSCTFYGEKSGDALASPQWSSDGCSIITGVNVTSKDITPTTINYSGMYWVLFDFLLSCEQSLSSYTPPTPTPSPTPSL